jgi:hypothetical protein
MTYLGISFKNGYFVTLYAYFQFRFHPFSYDQCRTPKRNTIQLLVVNFFDTNMPIYRRRLPHQLAQSSTPSMTGMLTNVGRKACADVNRGW